MAEVTAHRNPDTAISSGRRAHGARGDPCDHGPCGGKRSRAPRARRGRRPPPGTRSASSAPAGMPRARTRGRPAQPRQSRRDPGASRAAAGTGLRARHHPVDEPDRRAAAPGWSFALTSANPTICADPRKPVSKHRPPCATTGRSGVLAGRPRGAPRCRGRIESGPGITTNGWRRPPGPCESDWTSKELSR